MQAHALQGRLAGLYVERVGDALKLHRILWRHSFQSRPRSLERPEPNFRSIPLGTVREALQQAQSDSTLDFLHRLEEQGVCKRRGDEFLFHLDLLHPVKAATYAVGSAIPEQDLRYFVLRSIRFRYDRHLASSTAKLLHRLARAANELAAAESSRPAESNHPGTSRHRPRRRFAYHEVFLPALESALDTMAPISRQNIAFFVEVCTAVDYLKPNFDDVSVTLRTSTIDAEYLLSNLFGLTTGIQGFDDLFGGGGVILAEAFGAPPQKQSDDSQSIWGRTLLIEGQSGTGKSMLSLQLAVEVARKGGLVWIESLEQPAEESLYALEAIQALPLDGSVVVATRTLEAVQLLESRKPGVGGIIILRGEKSSFSDLLDNIVAHADRMKEYPIRLIVVDPINSVIRDEYSEPVQLRARMLEAIEEIKRRRTNLCLIAEENSTFADDLLFEKNIADVVVHLSVAELHNYAQRYISVHKSRLQREQRGEHPFVIVPGEGISIYPSPAAVLNKIRARSIQPPDNNIDFGMPALDRILGKEALSVGDVIVLQGPGGTYRTPFGISFLLERDAIPFSDNGFKSGSLWVMVRDNIAAAKRLLSSGLVRERPGQKQINDIRLCPLPAGHVQPGYILQRIEDEIVGARRSNIRIDRVMIDDVAHWELSSPFVRDDDTFADTLIELLQRQGVTALYTCSQIAPQEWSVLQRSIIDRADCILEFDRVEFLGVQRVRVRVQITPGMGHRRDALEVKLNQGRIELEPTPSLLRVDAQGNVSGVSIRLLLHGETQAHVEYQSGLRDALRAVLSKNVDVEPQNVYMSKALAISGLSVIDEAQMLQVDEFELLRLTDRNQRSLSLHRFAPELWDEEWNDFLPELQNRGRRSDGSFFAVPFYSNLSILVHRSGVIPSGATPSWRELADLCRAWERENHTSEEVFFDFPREKNEAYNCLFLEILASIEPVPQTKGSCQLREWLGSTAAVEAGVILRQLCRRTYLLDSVGTRPDERLGYKIVTFRKAQVWRLWYSMLSELAQILSLADREDIRVAPLPGDISIAGEWYLAVPAYSSAPEVTLEILRMLTRRDAELERLSQGVGLPTRKAYYEESGDGGAAAIAPGSLFELPRGMVAQLLKSAIRRSRFGCYPQISGSLAHHIRQIIEIPDRPEEELRNRVEVLLQGFQQSIDLMGLLATCSTCRNPK